ncbi:TolC family protein [Undibacterium sp. Ren11W]|uniref:TolC family protein n=1 Tax=Undibacterium sp. Ren11W TaxID=3413045 RepID=UPI003BF234C3
MILMHTRRNWRMAVALLPVLAGFAGLATISGCASKNPPNRAELSQQAMQQVQLPAHWVSAKTAGQFDAEALGFELPAELQALILEAQANNPDLRLAASRVAQSQVAAKAAGAALLPSLGLGAQIGESVIPTSSMAVNGLALVVNWEIDIWGKVRDSQTAATEISLASELDILYARQSIAAAVVKAWLAIAEANSQLRLAQEMSALSQKQLKLMLLGQQVGRNTQFDVVNNQISLKVYQQQVIQSEQALSSGKRALEVLIGRYPGAEIAINATLPASPSPIPVGLPSDLAERRPDMRAAEGRFRAAFYNVEIAKKAKLPSISLKAGLGILDKNVLAFQQDLSNPVTGISAGFLAPLFTGGALDAQIEVKTLQQQEATVAYAKSMLTALSEIEAGLYADQKLEDRYRLLEAQLGDQQKLVELQRVQIKVGKGDMYQLQMQELGVVNSRINLLRMQNERLIQRVNLHLALGGVYKI